MTERDRDLGLSLPLHGQRLVEASAGTGKTFTLATLYARLVIEMKLPVEQILAVTFTEAATQELRTRIRQRLRLAVQLAEGGVPEKETPEVQLTRDLVQAALAQEPAASLRLRLRLAAEAMDLAPVYTIHGFCRRALSDHAIEAGQAPGDIELVKNERALREEIATDLWRETCQDPLDARVLMSTWSSPTALAQSLRELTAVDVLLPPPAPVDPGLERRLQQALAEAAADILAAYRTHADDTRAQLHAAIAEGWMHASHFSRERLELGWGTLELWVLGGCQGPPPGDDDDRKRLLLAGDSQIEAKTNKAHKSRTAALRNPLTAAIDAWEALRLQVAALDEGRGVALVHRLRDAAIDRLARLKGQRRQQGFDDLIRGLAQALAGEGGEPLADRLRAQYRVALVDEFQDTDPLQWRIFDQVFARAPGDGGVRALFLIGDPKQAIYRFRGGDVFTYLDAAAGADQRVSLDRNFRSRPRVLQALQALYAGAGDQPFGQADIEFVPVVAGGTVTDHALRIDGQVPAGLQLMTWPDAPQGQYRAADARALATTACVARIRELLQPTHAQLLDRDQLRPVQPGDIAVLVERHAQAQQVQRALARAGVPSVTAGRESLYASDEARDLLALFDACLHLADDSRLRGALATPLLGLDATAIAALDHDDAAHRQWQDRALAWRQRWDRHGPLALVTDLCALNAPRLLGLDDGERRLTNWLQLAESLQSATAGHAAAAVADLLRERIASADADNEEELLRLESDAARVKVLTLHKSKGLEFPLVLLPFLSQAGSGGPRGGLALARFHDGVRRVARLKAGGGEAWSDATAKEKAEVEAEKLRLLYVGLTRARLASWVCFGPTKDAHETALAALLRFAPAGGKPTPLDATTIRARLETLALLAPDAVGVTDAPSVVPPGAPWIELAPVVPAAAEPRRRFSRDGWVHSFSGLAREAGGAEERRASDESEPVLPSSRFSGARFGNVMHEALENVDFAAWRDWRDDVPPAGQSLPLEQALRAGGYGSPADQAEGLPLLARLVRHTLNAALPEGVRLCDLPASQRRPEMEFHFSLAPTRIDTLLPLLHAQGLVVARQGFGLRERLEGLMTGFIDLVYEHAGRYYLLDYKSNQLPDYAPAVLADAMAHSEYDLQYLLYTIALHRWLGFRLPGYDYDRHFGGVRYLFCRGLDPFDPARPGIYASTPPRSLVESLDALLRPAAGEAA